MRQRLATIPQLGSIPDLTQIVARQETPRPIDGMLDALRDPKGQRPRLVHRLNKETAGWLRVAKTRFAATALANAFRSRAARLLGARRRGSQAAAGKQHGSPPQREPPDALIRQAGLRIDGLASLRRVARLKRQYPA